MAPEKAVSLYSMQVVTAKPGMVAYWHLPKVLPREIQWLVVYVMLSRVTSLTQLQFVALGIRVRRIIEAGAPEHIVQTSLRLFRAKIRATLEEAHAARTRLGWLPTA